MTLYYQAMNGVCSLGLDNLDNSVENDVARYLSLYDTCLYNVILPFRGHGLKSQVRWGSLFWPNKFPNKIGGMIRIFMGYQWNSHRNIQSISTYKWMNELWLSTTYHVGWSSMYSNGLTKGKDYRRNATSDSKRNTLDFLCFSQKFPVNQFSRH